MKLVLGFKRDRGRLRERYVTIEGEYGDVLEATSLYLMGRDLIESGLKPKQFKRFLAEAARELWGDDAETKDAPAGEPPGNDECGGVAGHQDATPGARDRVPLPGDSGGVEGAAGHESVEGKACPRDPT